MMCDSYWNNNAFGSSQSSSSLRINQSYMSNFPSASRQVVENYNWTPLAFKKRFNSCRYISNNIFTYIGLAPRVSSSRCRCLLLIAIRLDWWHSSMYLWSHWLFGFMEPLIVWLYERFHFINCLYLFSIWALNHFELDDWTENYE